MKAGQSRFAKRPFISHLGRKTSTESRPSPSAQLEGTGGGSQFIFICFNLDDYRKWFASSDAWDLGMSGREESLCLLHLIRACCLRRMDGHSITLQPHLQPSRGIGKGPTPPPARPPSPLCACLPTTAQVRDTQNQLGRVPLLPSSLAEPSPSGCLLEISNDCFLFIAVATVLFRLRNNL